MYHIMVVCKTERVARKLTHFLASYQSTFPTHDLGTFEYQFVGVKDIKLTAPDEQTFDNLISVLEKTESIFKKMIRKPFDAWECDEFGHIVDNEKLDK